MNDENKFTNANKTLLFAWHLLREFENWKKSPQYKKGLMPFEPYFFTGLSELISPTGIINYLQGFLVRGIVRKFRATEIYYGDEDAAPIAKDVSFTSGEVIKKEKKEFLFHILPEYNNVESSWSLFIDLNWNKCEKFVKTYLDYWKNDKLKHDKKNLLQSRKQLGKLAYNIKKLLEDYPSVNLLLKYSYLTYDEVDFFASLFFLEHVRDIEIAELTSVDGVIAFRINILEKFYRDFPHNGQFLDEYNVINNVELDKITGSLSKEEMVDKIVLKAPKLLVYKGFEYEIKENKVPYHLIHLAVKNKGKVDRLELKNITEETQERIKKALNNFRKGLRAKFKLPSTELFFEQKGGLILFKEELFDFS